VVVSTKLTELNTCPGNNCKFTYSTAATSPTLSAISTMLTGVGQVTLNGSNLLDGNNFSEVAMLNTQTGGQYLLSANQSAAAFVVFNITVDI
jgi:hypothetical protein